MSLTDERLREIWTETMKQCEGHGFDGIRGHVMLAMRQVAEESRTTSELALAAIEGTGEK